MPDRYHPVVLPNPLLPTIYIYPYGEILLIDVGFGCAGGFEGHTLGTLGVYL